MATGCECDDVVPPLEDLSDFIGQIKTLGFVEEKKERLCNESEVQQASGSEQVDILKEDDKEIKKAHVDGKNKIDTAKSDNAKVCEKSKQTFTSKADTFGGFQKGFLKKNTKQSKDTALKDNTKPISSKEQKIPTICPKESDPNDVRIIVVQEAMKTSFFQNKDLITDEFLKKLKDRPDLRKKLADPRYRQVFGLFRTNRQEAWKLINDSQELQIFIKEFSGLLGEQFTTMADQNKSDGRKATGSTASLADEQKMAEIMSDPETLAVLKDPWIIKLVTNSKENPNEARRMLLRSRPEVLPKIKKLVDAGILTFG